MELVKFLVENVFKNDLLEKGLFFFNKLFVGGSWWVLEYKLCLEISDLKNEIDLLVIYFFIMMELLFG